MNSETVTAWATAMTALGALALIGVTLRVEYLRRRHEKGQFHFQQLRELVFDPLKQELVGHYIPILERQDGLLRLDTEEKSSTFDPLHGKKIEWSMKLAVKSASLDPGCTVGDYQRFIDYDATFPHLYHDTKISHFPELCQRWEFFRERVKRLGEQSLERCLIWQRRLEEHVHLPIRQGLSTPPPWADYVVLSLYFYEQLWWRHPNGASVFQESGYSALRFQSYDLVRGDQHHIATCLATVGKLLETESVADLISLAEQLKPEATALKGEFERLVLAQLPLRSCPYVKVPLI